MKSLWVLTGAAIAILGTAALEGARAMPSPMSARGQLIALNTELSTAINAAYKLYQSGQTEAAIVAYEQAIAASQQQKDTRAELQATIGLGTIYRETQQTQKAIPLLKTAIQLAGNQPQQALQKMVALFGLGRVYADLSDHAIALDYYQQALRLSDQLGDNLTRNGILNNLGTIHIAQGNYAEAKSVLTQAVTVSQQTQKNYQTPITASSLKTYCDRAQSNPTTSLDQLFKQVCTAGLPAEQLAVSFEPPRLSIFQQAQTLEINSLNNLGLVERHQGNYPLALQYHEKSRDLSQAIGKQDSIATSLNNLANLYTAMGDYSKALTLFNQTRTINEAMNDRFQLSRTVGNIGYVYSQQGEFRKGLEEYQIALEIAQKTGDQEQLATLHNNMAANYQSLGNFPAANSAYEQALKRHQATGSRSGIAVTTANLGVLQSTIGNFGPADRALQEALKQAQAIGTPTLIAMTYGNLAQLYSDQGQYAKALDFYTQALELHRKLGDRANESNTLISIGSTYRAIGKPSKAQTHCKQALDLANSIGAKATSALSLGCLGNVALEQSQYAQSQTLLTQSLAAHRAIGNRRSEIITLKAIGRLASEQQQPQQAIASLQQGLQLAQELGLKLEETELLTQLGKTQLQLRQPQAAQASLQAAIQLADPIGHRVTAAAAKTLLGELFIQSQQFDQAQPILNQAIETWESLRPGLTDSDRISLFELQRKTYALQQQALVGQKQTEAAIVMAERGRARALVELMAHSGNLANPVSSPASVQPPTLAQIKSIAQTQNVTIVQYSVISNQLIYAWVIQPNGTIDFKPVQLADTLPQMVTMSRDVLGVRGRASIAIEDGKNPPSGQLLDSDERAIQSMFRQLHQILIEPIAAYLPRNPDDRVVIIPQDELFLLSFSALTDAQGRALIERHTLSSAPSIQSLALTHALKRPGRSPLPLIVGNPQMPLYQGKPLSPLPGSEREAQQIATLFRSSPLVGAQATKSAVLSRFPQATHIHLATHGLLDTLRGEVPGAIALTATSGNDGFLTASEIMDLKLTADLVVLSACNTGEGDLTGDGVIGLSRSLLVAGVPSTIVSLWKVNDESTAMLMTEFYKNLMQRQLPKSQALRQAMLTTQKQYPKPADWAAFSLVGEGQ